MSLCLLAVFHFAAFVFGDPAARAGCLGKAGLLTGNRAPCIYGSFRWDEPGNPKPFTVVQRLRYFGKQRNEFIAQCNGKYGEGGWAVGYYYQGKMISAEEALQVYEDAYFDFLSKRPELVDEISRRAKDVYDYDVGNVVSGMDYSVQEGPRTHLQDISVRRAMARLGRKFEGTELLQIRDENTPLFILHPGRVPLANPAGVVLQPRGFAPKWILPDTAEDFWQNNKFLVVKAGAASGPVVETNDHIFTQVMPLLSGSPGP